MRTYLTKCMVIVITTILLLCSFAQAYPPDNAAVLYYESFLLMQDANDAMTDQLTLVIKGEADANESVIKYVEVNKLALDYAFTATTISMCDWGLDYSKGFDMPLPYIGKGKTMTRLMLADAKITSMNGNCREALEKCLASYRLARHIGDDSFGIVPFLMGVSIQGLTNSCIQSILPQMAKDVNSLRWLDAQLVLFASDIPSLKVAVANDFKGIGSMFNREQMLQCVADVAKQGENAFAQEARRRIESADERFFVANKTYWNDYMQRICAAMDLNYPKAFATIKEMVDNAGSEAMQKPNATLTALCVPGIHSILSLDIRSRTHLNALRTAIAIYTIKAKTGNLPQSLPAQMPVDLFSGKPFQYEITADGFILRCQGKDLNKNETYEYAFKIQK
jgi:hypothetical protein